jgi:periplasmic protein TonB
MMGLRVFPCLATSVLVHAGVLLGGVLSLGLFTQARTSPGIWEVTLGDFQIESGLSRPEVKARSSVKKAVSPLNLESKHESKTSSVTGIPQQAMKGAAGNSVKSAGEEATEWDRYRFHVRERILEALVYPRASKNLGEQGQVKVRLKVERDGTISDAEIAEPSAFLRLNTAALDTVRRVAQLDPLPESFSADQWSALVPIDFSLK